MKGQKAGPVLEVSSASDLDDDQPASASSAKMANESKNASATDKAAGATGNPATPNEQDAAAVGE